MANVKLVLEYDGGGFHGWQSQPGMRTIEAELLRVLRMVLREEISGLATSSRTDAGVHARGHVVSFRCAEAPNIRRLRQSVSHIFKNEISVLSAEIVPDDFHPRRAALAKWYRYTILNRDVPPVLDYGRVWHIAGPLDLSIMAREAQALVGTHDFSSLRDSGCTARSAIKAVHAVQIDRQGAYILIDVTGQGFLKHMVRNIVGTLVGFSRGTLDVGSMQELLQLRDRRRAGVTAPPYGLCLESVSYPVLSDDL